jgi:hypothetical protein
MGLGPVVVLLLVACATPWYADVHAVDCAPRCVYADNTVCIF